MQGRKRFWFAVTAIVAIVAFAANVWAVQVSNQADPVSADADDVLLIAGVRALAGIANAECTRLKTSEEYVRQLQRVTGRIEQKHPGYTVDWSSGGLVHKAQ